MCVFLSRINKMRIYTRQSLLKWFDRVYENYDIGRNANDGTTLDREVRRDLFDDQVSEEIWLDDVFTVVDCSKRGVTIESDPYLIELDLGFKNEAIGLQLHRNQTISIKLKVRFSDFFCGFRYPNYFLMKKINKPIKIDYMYKESVILGSRKGLCFLTEVTEGGCLEGNSKGTPTLYAVGAIFFYLLAIGTVASAFTIKKVEGIVTLIAFSIIFYGGIAWSLQKKYAKTKR